MSDRDLELKSWCKGTAGFEGIRSLKGRLKLKLEVGLKGIQVLNRTGSGVEK